MSIYTEAEHVVAISDTLKWIENPPASPESRYAYGLYHLRLKDYNEALRWFLFAAEDGVEAAFFDIGECLRHDLVDRSSFTQPLPEVEICYKKAFAFYSHADTQDSTVLFRLGYMQRYGLGCLQDTSAALALFLKVQAMYTDLTPDDFNVTCNYSIEGSGITSAADICKLPLGESCFEISLYYLNGITPIKKNISKGRALLKNAYDFHSAQALLLDFKLFGQDYAAYEYQDDIRELYSFIIGQYGRVCDVHPSVKAYGRLIAMYENGYPGDEGQRKSDFAVKAKPLYKKMEAYFSSSNI